ncbi:efflux RND transporter permease subunit [Parabacteroides sp. PF5-9]|uniref:efflux RND transporter permease subunit n=1 Tax=Parabacteroides sp. PF5-9 TaxID=1742404 RepID=UPI002476C330|nr:efflux RND transporter permease subunit [Parabacteroides sp. PF5-9]MDH6358053.1 HAE1 family hydrophobic/amphiphilic exporter-1 [Parabacteroides sp. PF5-9]
MKLDRFINRPVLSTVISVIIVIVGILGLISLPVEQYPDIAPPTVMVYTSYTGANAQTVLNTVIAPIEEQLNGVENMLYMSSTASNTGTAMINVYFKQGTDPDMAAVNVQNRVSKAQGLLPAEVTRVGVITQKRQTSMLQGITIFSDGRYDQTFLQNYAKINIMPLIQRVNGVGDAMVMGARDYTMRIWLKPEIMAQYMLMPSDISAALAEQNIEAAPGQFGENGDQSFQYVIRYKGRLETPEEFEEIVIRSTADGNILRLKDVARIELGGQSYSVESNANGKPALTFMVFQMAGSNATEVINEIDKVLEESAKSFPPGMSYEVLMSVNDFLFASIYEVIKTLIEAFLLVFLVVYIFLQDIRSTLIPSIAIPVALLGTFAGLTILGFSINLLTLCALVLAIAIVVDDAIVVVEAVHAKLDQGYKSSKQASIDAMGEIGGAIVSITLVMMSVFIPVSFMGGTAGTFYKQFGLTLAIAIGFSAVNALTLSPALCAIFLKPHTDHEGKKKSFVDRFHIAFNTSYNKLLEKYKKGVMFVIQRKWIGFALVIGSVVVLGLLMKTTPTGMVPSEDTGTLMVNVTMQPGTSLEVTDATMNQIDGIIAANPHIQSRSKISGYGMIGGQGTSYGSFICRLKDWDERTEKGSDVNGVIATLTAQLSTIKDARIMLFTPPMIPGYSISSGFELNLQDKVGGNLDQFFQEAQGFLGKLNQRPEILYAQTTFNPTFPQYQLDIDAAKCKRAGISPTAILSTMQGYYGGLYASNFNRFGKLYRVYIQAEAQYRINPESLQNIYIRNGNEMAPISEFVTLEKIYGPDNITRFNMFTSMLVNGAAAPGYSSGDAINAIKEVAAETLSSDYGYEFSGMTREEESSGDMTIIIFALCILFVYLLLSAQYESYILPLAVILSIPFGLAGTFIFARMMGVQNDIYLQIALIMLIGLLAKNAILIVEFALERRRTGMGISWSALLGAAARLRPILMTSLAMVIGLLPLMFANGVGANGYRTLGSGAVGGMLIGMLGQIFIVPVLFVVFQYLQEKISPLEWEDMDNSDMETEIEQYAKS